jgi:argininosuccinate lyase
MPKDASTLHGHELHPLIKAYTVGEDYLLDRALAPYDCAGSIAHATMLRKIGILKQAELDALVKGLRRIVREFQAGEFKVLPEHEDVHTAVEKLLTERLGEPGKKLHTGRSRNDQVILDLRLWMKDALLDLSDAVLDLVGTLIRQAARYRSVPIVGRTHTQPAMPSSVGLWMGAFAESLLDDLALVRTAFALVDRSPLGSAASYGVALPIDRALVARLLGFADVQNNVLYCNNSRGKFEAVLLNVCAQVMLDLSRFAADVILWSLPEFGYFRLPADQCPGSSLMPNKRNPCGLEILRARTAQVFALEQQVLNGQRGLCSGYNRDNQETKAPLFTGMAITADSVRVAALTAANLVVDRKRCIAAFTPEVFATDKVLDLTRKGLPFRDIYYQVKQQVLDGTLAGADPVANIRSKTHQGAPGNLRLDLVREATRAAAAWTGTARRRYHAALARLLGGTHRKAQAE